MNNISTDIGENEKKCPICKNKIPKEVTVCPICKSDLSVGGNVAKILTSIGIILTLCITVPIVLSYCGMCSLF